MRPRFWRDQTSYDLIMTPVGFVLTFGGVVVTFVFFRASSVSAAISVLRRHGRVERRDDPVRDRIDDSARLGSGWSGSG